MKFIETNFTNPQKSIVKYPDHYVNIAVTVDDTGIVANADGKKIVPAGTIVGGGFLEDEAVKAVKTNALGAEGVLFEDVDVTYGPTAGAVLVHGFVDLNKLPEAPVADAKNALAGRILFVK